MARSPFPGMDPYIEAAGLWENFHEDLIAEMTRRLRREIPQGYLALMRKRSYVVLVETDEKAERPFLPDVSLTAPRGRGPGRGARAVSANGPVSMRAFIEQEFEEKFIDIIEQEPERRLVTSIEVLSPSNKARGSRGWKKYLRKRQALLLGKANLIEIDLLRGGTRLPMLDPWPDAPYTVLVARETEAPRCKVWAAHCDRPLPSVPVPLSSGVADLTLELQPLLSAVYEDARYAEQIDYGIAIEPSLRPEEAAFLAGRAKPKKRKGRQGTR